MTAKIKTPKSNTANPDQIRISMILVGGHNTILTTSSRDLYNEVITELKANSTFQRNVVRSWNVEYL